MWPSAFAVVFQINGNLQTIKYVGLLVLAYSELFTNSPLASAEVFVLMQSSDKQPKIVLIRLKLCVLLITIRWRRKYNEIQK